MADAKSKISSDANPDTHSSGDKVKQIAAPITHKADNALQLRSRAKESLSTYRLTKDPSNSFRINTGDVDVKDRRPVTAATCNAKVDQATKFASPVRDASHPEMVDPELKVGSSLAAKPAHIESIETLSSRLNSSIDAAIFKNASDKTEPAELMTKETKFLETFKANLNQFQQTAHQRGLLPQDVQKTLYQVDRLMNTSDGALSPLNCQFVAGEIMMHAAHPKGIDQGRFNTCNVTTVESRAFARNPGEASRVIADIAVTGFYETTEKYAMPDGEMAPLRINGSTRMDTYSAEYPSSGVRTFAGEIFQSAAVNVYYALGDRMRGEHLEYREIDTDGKDKHDTGERIYDTDIKQDVPDVTAPDLPDEALPIIMDAITGTSHGRDLLLVHDNYHAGPKDNLTCIDSLDGLKRTLHRLKEDHLLPVILKVNCLCEPFYSDGNFDQSAGFALAHVVTVTDYDAAKGLVMVDNQWGTAVDHDRNNPIDITQLYVAMQVTSAAMKALQDQIDDERAHRIFDPRKHMDHLRLANVSGVVTDSAYEKGFENELRGLAARWDKISPRERKREGAALIAMTHNLDAFERESSVDKVYKHGLISNSVHSAEAHAARAAAADIPTFYSFAALDLGIEDELRPKKDKPQVGLENSF